MLALGSIGPWEITLVVLLALLLFGAKRLPELARGLGKGIREFRGAVSDTKEQIKSGLDDESGSAGQGAPGAPGAENAAGSTGDSDKDAGRTQSGQDEGGEKSGAGDSA